MTVFDWERQDLEGRFFDATLKPMESTGEVVARIRSAVPGMHTKRSSITMAPVWDYSANPPWQKPHLHRGLTEGYVVTKGWMLAVWRQAHGGYIHCFVHDVSVSPMITFAPKVAHNVLLGPGAEIVVWQAGDPQLNNDMREPQDRFPCNSFDPGYLQFLPSIQALFT